MDVQTCISAACKHLNDIDLLFENGRCDNVSYLSGYVVECGLKSLLVPIHTDMPSLKQLGHELNLIRDDALALAISISPARRRYHLPKSSDFDDLLQAWKPDDRYEKEGTVGRELAESRLRAAREVFEALLAPQILDFVGVEI